MPATFSLAVEVSQISSLKWAANFGLHTNDSKLMRILSFNLNCTFISICTRALVWILARDCCIMGLDSTLLEQNNPAGSNSRERFVRMVRNISQYSQIESVLVAKVSFIMQTWLSNDQWSIPVGASVWHWHISSFSYAGNQNLLNLLVILALHLQSKIEQV